MKTFIHTFIFTFAIFVCSFVQGQTVHWILAIDNLANKKAAMADYSHMVYSITNGIKSDQLGEHLLLDLETDSQVQIFDKIRGMKIGNNDTVLFYYSGHGAMDMNNNNALTYCIIKEVVKEADGNYLPKKYMYIPKKSIIDTLRAKNPRLIVVLSDCCSVKTPIPPPPDDEVAGIVDAPTTLPLYRSLFLESKGLVDINGAQDGEPSLWYLFSKNEEYDDEERKFKSGSIFTDAFCDCLHKYENQRMDWKTFFPLVQKTTESLAAKEINTNPTYWKGQNVTGQKPKAISLGGNGGAVPPSSDKPIFGVRGLNRNDGNGVTVTEVLRGYPGARAGLEKGDVILEIDGRKIRNERDYSDAVDAAGTIMNLKIRNVRNGQILNIRVQLQ